MLASYIVISDNNWDAGFYCLRLVPDSEKSPIPPMGSVSFLISESILFPPWVEGSGVGCDDNTEISLNIFRATASET
jgi:hypothetical protein